MSRVEHLAAAAFRIPTDQPESDGTLEWEATVLVVVEAGAGGETGLGYTYAHQAVVGLVEDKLAPLVLDADPHQVRRVNLAMRRAVRNLGCTGLASLAISAVDVALWDLHARLLGAPLVDALGAVRDAVPVYGSGGFTSYDDGTLARQLAGWVAAGIPRVKLKTGREPDRDRHRLAVARDAIGPDVELYVDANGAFTPRQAVEWARVYREQFDVRWFEEPVSSDDIAGLRFVRDRSPGGIDIAAGEYGWNPWGYPPLFTAVDCVQVDVTRCLGITGFLQVAVAGEVHQVPVSAHCAPQLSAHACCAVPRLAHLEYFHDHTRIDALLFDGVLDPEPGGLLRPDRSRPGHGLSLRHDAAEQYRIA